MWEFETYQSKEEELEIKELQQQLTTKVEPLTEDDLLPYNHRELELIRLKDAAKIRKQKEIQGYIGFLIICFAVIGFVTVVRTIYIATLPDYQRILIEK